MSGDRRHVAEWVFDPRRRHVLPADDNAARMALQDSEPPQPAAPSPGEATVTQLAPRLSAASGQGLSPPGSPAGFGAARMGNGGPGNGRALARLHRWLSNGGRARHELPGSGRPAVSEPAPSRPDMPTAPGRACGSADRVRRRRGPTPGGDLPPAPASGRHSAPERQVAEPRVPEAPPSLRFPRPLLRPLPFLHAMPPSLQGLSPQRHGRLSRCRGLRSLGRHKLLRRRPFQRRVRKRGPTKRPLPPQGNRPASRRGVRAGSRRAASGPPSPSGMRSCSVIIVSETNPPQVTPGSGLAAFGRDLAAWDTGKGCRL